VKGKVSGVKLLTPCIFNLMHVYEHSYDEQDGTDRLLLDPKRSCVSMGRPVLALQKLEQLPGL
jgi:hypothetical protein